MRNRERFKVKCLKIQKGLVFHQESPSSEVSLYCVIYPVCCFIQFSRGIIIEISSETFAGLGLSEVFQRLHCIM